MNISKCIFCGNDLASYDGYVTDGKMGVCNLCAGRYTISHLMTRLKLHKIDSTLKKVFTPPVDVTASFATPEYGSADNASLNVQTEPATIADEIGDEIANDIMEMSYDDFYSKYADNVAALNAYHDTNGEPSDFMV